MSRCNWCGQSFYFSGRTIEGVEFCSQLCANDWTANQLIESLGQDEFDEIVRERRSGSCPKCAGPGPVDVRQSRRVLSFFYAAVSEPRRHVGCDACTRRGVRNDLLLSVLI